MASAPPESVPPQRRASGAEIAPLVHGAAEPAEEPGARAAREVAEAEALREEWEATHRDEAPFDLTVQPSIGGEEAAVTLEGVTSQMSAAELHERIHAEMESKPTPDEQRLFIVDGAKGPLEDETLPIGAYGVVAGVTLHLVMRDGQAAAARRAVRAQVRAEQAAALAARAALLARRKAQVKAVAKVLVPAITLPPLVLLIIWLANGCGGNPCGDFGECSGGLSAQCTCQGNYTIGEFCEEAMIMRSGYNGATVQAVEYTCLLYTSPSPRDA